MEVNADARLDKLLIGDHLVGCRDYWGALGWPLYTDGQL